MSATTSATTGRFVAGQFGKDGALGRHRCVSSSQTYCPIRFPYG